MSWDERMKDFEARRRHARGMGGPERLAKRREEGRLNARERIDRLVDAGSFLELGTFNVSDMAGDEAKTPADSKVAGLATIDGRAVAVASNDFTVMAATSSRVASRKEAELKALATKRGLPIIYLAEAGGARMPDIMGAAGIASFGNSTYYGTRLRQVPMLTAVLGQSYGLPTWNACLSDIVVMWTGASMAVSGPRVLELATGERVSPEDLGGIKVHAEDTGFADLAGESDEACLALVKRALSYLPAHAGAAPPRAAVPDGSGSQMATIADLVPESRTRAYDMRRVIERMADGGEILELKPRFGRAIITALTRIGGRVLGVVANQPSYKAGACDADGCDKVISFLCLCDSFNIPLLFLHDIPGFFIGRDAERQGVPGKIINWMEALAQVTVPRISVIVRKTYGQAYFNMGGGDYSDLLLAWPTADMSFMDPDTGVNVVHGAGLAALDPAERASRRKALLEQWEWDTLPYGAAARHLVHEVIAPADTRRIVIQFLDAWESRGVIGQHRLANWPTKF
ncbi:MAG TPA: carboxyl transferase domain-containing protein [Candidatus Bathyarchaeia archaeon]|nr:carboxyl transferase domain-containing protein [Candidatus Bathyarchaeia archaeon]